MFRSCFLLLCALLLTLPVLATPTAAVCVIKHQQQLLLVQDRISSRYSLTGGYIDAGETPRQAALRELFEETGLRGQIIAELGPWQRAVLFACQTLEPIRAQTGSGFVSLLQAPNLGGEILNARLIEPSRLPDGQRRFPTQLDWLAPQLADIPDSPVLWLPDFSGEGNALHRAELPLIQRWQEWIGARAPWLDASNLFGSAAFQLALLPLLLPWLGWSRLRQLLLAMLSLTLLIQVAKEGLGWPRPFHLDPALTQGSAQGFGMPSGHAASALLFWGLLLRWCWPANLWRGAVLALLLATLTGLARVWLGVHFLSDVAAGLVLGALMLTISPGLSGMAARPWFWGGLTLICALATWWSQSSALAGLAMFSLGLTLGMRLPLPRERRKTWHTLAITLLGSLPLGALLWALPFWLTSSWLILLGQWLLYCCLGLWFSAGLWWILSLMNSDPLPKGSGPDKGLL
ncbi:MAG: phosphatase PAP2 family protein [Aeromonas popoffii]|uniref:bifunctional NUDIX hydrolase/phosphatase PAP2 family protein n=1 Tax=Aeromonas popoffii TaxID=70856 RepID=UPI003F360AF9